MSKRAEAARAGPLPASVPLAEGARAVFNRAEAAHAGAERASVPLA